MTCASYEFREPGYACVHVFLGCSTYLEIVTRRQDGSNAMVTMSWSHFFRVEEMHQHAHKHTSAYTYNRHDIPRVVDTACRAVPRAPLFSPARVFSASVADYCVGDIGGTLRKMVLLFICQSALPMCIKMDGFTVSKLAPLKPFGVNPALWEAWLEAAIGLEKCEFFFR